MYLRRQRCKDCGSLWPVGHELDAGKISPKQGQYGNTRGRSGRSSSPLLKPGLGGARGGVTSNPNPIQPIDAGSRWEGTLTLTLTLTPTNPTHTYTHAHTYIHHYTYILPLLQSSNPLSNRQSCNRAWSSTSRVPRCGGTSGGGNSARLPPPSGTVSFRSNIPPKGQKTLKTKASSSTLQIRSVSTGPMARSGAKA